MTTVKNRNPVEYSFLIWMNNHPESRHWADKERFYCFVKTVLRFGRRRWKDRSFIKQKILERRPHFDADYLDDILLLYDGLSTFHKTQPVRDFGSTREIVERRHFIEISVKKGKIIKRITPYKNNNSI